MLFVFLIIDPVNGCPGGCCRFDKYFICDDGEVSPMLPCVCNSLTALPPTAPPTVATAPPTVAETTVPPEDDGEDSTMAVNATTIIHNTTTTMINNTTTTPTSTVEELTNDMTMEDIEFMTPMTEEIQVEEERTGEEVRKTIRADQKDYLALQ
jgi:hypothetical protein